MGNIISKELFSEVLGIEFLQIVTDSKVIENNLKRGLSSSMIAYREGIEWSYINIHELAHKCKEWALIRGHCLQSCIHDNGSYEGVYCVCEILTPIYGSSSLFDALLKTTDAETEPEAIFKACQWILNNG
jgi:hypothetical protein